MVLHVLTSFLGGVPLCIPYGWYNGTSLGGTTRGTLEGYLGRVLSGDLVKHELKWNHETHMTLCYWKEIYGRWIRDECNPR